MKKTLQEQLEEAAGVLEYESQTRDPIPGTKKAITLMIKAAAHIDKLESNIRELEWALTTL